MLNELFVYFRLHFRPKTPPTSEHSPSEESSDSDSEMERVVTKSEPIPFPFPPEATSICVDIEPDRLDNEPPFTSEFNISDYFSVDTLSDFDLALGGDRMEHSEDDWRTDDIGCSQFLVLPEVGNLFVPQIRSQCSGSANSVNMLNCSVSSTLCTSNQLAVSNTSVSMKCTSVNIEVQSNHQIKQHRQLQNNSNAASILSKSLTSPTFNRSNSGGGLRVFGTTATATSGSGGTIKNLSNSHQNGPIAHTNNSKSLQNSIHTVNNQSAILLPQKHPPSNCLSSLNKLASLARQQQTQSQTQQIPTSGEITLNSNR